MLFCMRTTLNLEHQLMRDVKAKAAEEGRTLTAVIDDALRDYLRRGDETSTSFRLRLVTVPGKARDGVDLDDRDALYEVMEGRA